VDVLGQLGVVFEESIAEGRLTAFFHKCTKILGVHNRTYCGYKDRIQFQTKQMSICWAQLEELALVGLKLIK
jgi:hypothetical protein